MTVRNRRAGSPQPLYSLLDDRASEQSILIDRSGWHCGQPAPVEEIGAKHRAAWRSNSAARSQKIFRSV